MTAPAVAPPASLAALRIDAAARLAAAGVESAPLDARLLLQAATGRAASDLAADPDYVLSRDESARFERLLARRIAREPISHILGRAGFWTLDLEVTPDVLTPRPETEQVLEAALAATAERTNGLVLDLGVGPGTLLLGFLSERPEWRGVGADVSPRALAVARRNAQACGLADRVALVASNWDMALDPDARGFDLILSNPPYVTTAELAGLAPEVRDHEPRVALDGGADGLDAYRALAPVLAARLVPGGAAVIEIGASQVEAVADLLCAAAPGVEAVVQEDLAGRPRAIVLRRRW